jgi:signal transduction histidine kinase/HAMP domain-containing protein
VARRAEKGPNRTRTEFLGYLGTPSRVSLRTNLLLWFLGISLIPLALISGVGYHKALESRQEDVKTRLISISEERLLTLQEFFDDQFNVLDQQARASSNLEFLQDLAADLNDSGQSAEFWVRSERWKNLVNGRDRDLHNQLDHADFQDILLADYQGRVLYSCMNGPELGLDLNQAGPATAPLRWTHDQVLRELRPVFSGFAQADENDSSPVGYLAQSIRNQSGKPLGMLLLRLPSADLLEIGGQGKQLGAAGRTYLVNQDLVLLTKIRQNGWGAATGDRVLTEQTLGWVKERGLRSERPPSGFSEHNDFDELVSEYRDPGDVLVLGIHRTLKIQDVQLGIITEVDKSVTFAGVRSMRLGMALLLVFVSLIVALAGLLVSHRIAEPITSLGRAMQRVADGHRVSEMPVSGPNEVGRLAQQFGVMLKALNAAQTAGDRQYRLQKSQFELHEKMRGEPDLATLATSVLEYIGEYYSAQVGAFYLTRPGGRLVLSARFGLEEEIHLEEEIRIGQGIVGKTAQQGRSRILHDLPADHLPVKTAIGESSPNSLIIAPFLIEGQVKGVLELGTFGDFADGDLEFLRMSSESVAMALDSARSRERVHRLLVETRRQAGILSRQQKQLQVTNAQLARSDQYKNEFLANMSHELRTPLNSMLIMSQILAENQQGNLIDDQVEAAETINKAGSNLLMIINDILDLSRVEAGKLEISCEQVDVTEFLKNLESLFRPMADELGLEFRVEADSSLPDCFHSDQGRVCQILNNLLGNALKFTDHGSVVLRAYRPDLGELSGLLGNAPESWIAFSVVDTGIGMTGEKMALVFEAFNQGDGSIGRRFGGSGLGLSISRKMADLLGGQVRMESTEKEGSTFTLYLPLNYSPVVCMPGTESDTAEPESATDDVARPRFPANANDSALETVLLATDANRAAEMPGSESSWTNKRVLLCDQDMRSVFRLTRELELLGAKVQLARTWEEALSGAREKPDLALVDPSAFELETADAFSQLEENSVKGRFPAIAMVGEDSTDQIAAWPNSITKPVDVERLLHVAEGAQSVEPVLSGA